MKYRFAILIVCLSLLTGIAKADDETVKVKSDKIWGDNKKKTTYMEGNVRIVQGTTTITTDSTQVDLDKKIAIFEDKLCLIHPDVTITADHLEYNFKKKVGTFSQNVTLSRKEMKDSQGKVTKDAFKLTTAELYFESVTKDFTAKSQGRVEHKDFTGTANLIEYSDKKQELLFSGNANIKRPNGELITGEEVVINTKTNSIIVRDKVHLINEDVTILGEHLEYDYKKNHGTFTDNIVLDRAETKNASGKVIKDHFKLKTAGLYFESDTKNFVTQNQGTVEHKEFNGSADQIEYNDILQLLKFKKNAYIKRPKGEEIHGDSITIFIKDKNFIVKEHADINFKVDSADEAQAKEGKARKRFP
jgi:lipopolysaccharide transport protein LptA